jgi:hypothetical protein
MRIAARGPFRHGGALAGVSVRATILRFFGIRAAQ